MTRNPGVSIVVMAYNEEQNLGPTIDGIMREVPKATRNYEIIIVEDGSTDGTLAVAKQYARRNRRIRIVRHRINFGFGTSFKDGVAAAEKKYVIGFPGDNDTSPVSLRQIIGRANDRTVVISYPIDWKQRSLARHIISRSVVILFNLLFGMRLRYYTGQFLCRTGELQRMNLKSKGFAVYAEAKVRFRYMGMKFEEIPFEHIGRKFGTTKAISFRSLLETLETIGILLTDIFFRK
ncbi:hypothetical protein A2Z33_04010 [Candidatus Gottesmanbacteria bacterium RBG_16_52_11]|uniref:Glycosyltransferase 2-like domain-containing protein n=1 Tax=Candidatus Gottesmanbacteria bacterium RBG_16_52_11 TaxID=1798374 RepID=A0A1F5YWD6_9BACT|nr:MAG: hypothetical protein A2Z33_04010 [Candidatus Gottesmanbacteria bacterium RBG_16_52_11]